MYRLGFERGYLDSLLDEYVVIPFKRVFQWCDAMERHWTNFLSGGHSRESDTVEPHPETVEEAPVVIQIRVTPCASNHEMNGQRMHHSFRREQMRRHSLRLISNE